MISKINDAIVDEMLPCKNRPLDRWYPVSWIDAIVIKICDSQIANWRLRAAIGVNLDGDRDVLGLWLGPSAIEAAKQCMALLTDLKNRGIADALIVRCDGPKGLLDATRATWRDAMLQTRVGHGYATVCVTRRKRSLSGITHCEGQPTRTPLVLGSTGVNRRSTAVDVVVVAA